MLQAVIDIGTNTFNLVIADDRTGETLHNEKKAVRLGMGGISKGIIADDAAERAVQTLLYYKEVINRFQVDETVVTATSAVRNAGNKDIFINKVANQTGFDVQVLSGEEEANLIYLGVKHYLTFDEGAELIIDIGGGSVEFIIANSKEFLWMRSLEIGGQRLMDKFHTSDPISPEEIDSLIIYLTEQLSEVLQECRRHKVKSMIGSAGSFDTLQDMLLETVELTPEDHEIPLDYFEATCQKLTTSKRDERLAIPGMIEMRVDMIVVASLLVKFLITQLDISKLRVSQFALKEGILFGNTSENLKN
ncbi:MAG: exopolyphosphatase [Cyclobacteriaceae bacterium]